MMIPISQDNYEILVKLGIDLNKNDINDVLEEILMKYEE